MFENIFGIHEQALMVQGQRMGVLAGNLANADTPGYKTQDLDFQTAFQSALDGGTPQPVPVSGLAVKNDGNNVDLDREARLLAENALRFGVASNLMKSQFTQIKEAIKEGGS